MAKKYQLTHEGLQRLITELDELRNVKRVDIAEKLKIAIAFGDLSENSEYQSARDEQASVELRVTDIEDILENYEIIDSDKKSQKNNLITIGSRFVLSKPSDKNFWLQEYVLVGSTEADILENRISNESPLGAALIGKTEGEIAEGTSKAGVFSFKIVEIL